MNCMTSDLGEVCKNKVNGKCQKLGGFYQRCTVLMMGNYGGRTGSAKQPFLGLTAGKEE